MHIDDRNMMTIAFFSLNILEEKYGELEGTSSLTIKDGRSELHR